MTFADYHQTLVAAVRQLSNSERGRQVLQDLHVLLSNGGVELDSLDAHALVTLTSAVSQGDGWAVKEMTARFAKKEAST
jgi:hypothetical protein